MFDLLIIGAGIAGSSVYRACVAKGLSALLIDAELPYSGSKAALAVVAPHWHKEPMRSKVKRSLALHQEWGSLASAESRVYVKGVWKDCEKGRFYTIDPRIALIRPNLQARVKELREGMVSLEDGSVFEYQYGVVVCTGANAFSKWKPAQCNWGFTYIGAGGGGKLNIARLAPYQEIQEAHLRNERRVGSSTAGTQEKALSRLVEQTVQTPFSPASELIGGVRAYAGDSRWIADLYAPLWEGDVCYFTGLGKFGFAIAPALGEEIVERYSSRAISR